MMASLNYSRFFCLLSIISRAAFGADMADYRELTDDLLSSSSSEIRPNCNSSQVLVYIDIVFRQILQLDEQKQILSSNTWLRFSWHDCNLSWNVSKYNGIESVVIPVHLIWIPDICLYDNSEYVLKGIEEYYRVRVEHDGTVKYNFPSVLKSMCRINIEQFPFDKQECNLTFGSWSFSDNEVQIIQRKTSVDKTNYIKSSEWTLTDILVNTYSTVYSCCENSFSEVVFTIKLTRKPAIQLLNLIYPCMIISAITLIGFFLPPESGEKVSVSVTVLLSLAVFQLVITETLPPNSDRLPYLGFFFLANMIFVGLCCSMSVIVMNVFYIGENNNPLPQWMRFVFLECFAKIICYSAAKHEPGSSNSQEIIPNDSVEMTAGTENTCNIWSLQSTEDFQRRDSDIHQIHPDPTYTLTEKLKSHVLAKEDTMKLRKEYQTIALIINRVFTVVAILTYIILPTVFSFEVFK